MAFMKANSLMKTNRYLKSAKDTKAQVVRSVASSTAIETGESISKIESKIIHPRNSSNRVKLA